MAMTHTSPRSSLPETTGAAGARAGSARRGDQGVSNQRDQGGVKQQQQQQQQHWGD